MWTTTRDASTSGSSSSSLGCSSDMAEVMKMKIRFLVATLASCAALSAVAYNDMQLVYRGRLKVAGGQPQAQTLPMTFSVYAKKSDTTPAWSVQKDVPVDAGGLFQVALEGDGLIEAVDSGNAQWIGVSVDGGKEQYPRQELMASAWASKAARADALATSPSVAAAEVKRVDAKALSAKSLAVSGSVTVPSNSSPAPEDIRITGKWSNVPVRGTVRFFSQTTPKSLGPLSSSGGAPASFGTADCNCFAVFSATGTDLMPGACIMFKKGASIQLPSSAGLPNGASVRCWVYPIGAE